MGNDVFNGFWVNWEHGRIEGATLTLPIYQGLILVSFLTLFVQFSGACFWRILCFIIHQFRSTPTAQDGLFHQQQTILRNSVTAPNALWNLGRITVAWRDKVKAPIKNSLPLLAAALAHIAFFGAAGLLASQIASTTAGIALVQSGACGFVKELDNVRDVNSMTLDKDKLFTFNAEILLGRLTLTKSAAYVRSCYADHDNTRSTECNVFVKPRLEGVNASTVYNASCPFGSNACAGPAARFDSGHVHSNDDLGINYSRRTEGLSMRRVTTCAPIVSERYATDWMPDLPENFGNKTNTTVKFYEFGKGDVGCRATWWNRTTPLTTFCVSQYMKDYWQQAYTVEASTVYQDNQAASDFDPIPDFQVPNADVTLISIYNKASYTGENDDLLFNAKNPSSKSPVFRTATSDLAVLGCLEQYQTCNPVNGKCTELEGLYGVKKAVDQGDLELSPRQNASQFIMWKAAWSMALQWACEILADNVLLAQDWVFTGQSTTSSTLLSNQWEFEAYNLHNLSLAVFQRRIHEFASPEHFEIRPGNNSLEQIDRPTDPNLLNLCAVQKTRSSDHYSLSVLGMTIILGVGSLLILLDWVFIKQILWFRSFTHHRLAKQADWTASGTLQLHRMAMEARGVLGWNTRHYEAPVLVGNARVFRGVAAEGEPLYRVAGMSGSGVTEYKGAGGSYSVVGGEIGHEVGVTYDGVEPEKKC